MWILLNGYNLIVLVSYVQGAVVYPPAASCYRRPAFEAINLADADFASDSHTSAPRYNNGFSPATDSFPGQPTDDGNCHISHSDFINRGNEMRIRNDAGAYTDWPQNFASVFHDHSRTEVNELEPINSLPTQNTNYCDEIHVHRNTDHRDFHWQQVAVHNGSDTSTTNKLNVSGVFSSLNEYLNAGKNETKCGDVNIISNQASLNLASHCPLQTEENGNCAVNDTDASAIVGTKGNYENCSSVLYPLINTVTEVQAHVLGGLNMSDDLQVNSHNDDLRTRGDRWESTVDVCRRSESNIHSSFADLIPITYSGSVQEEANFSGLSMIGVHAASDETPDLLDTAISSNKSDNFSSSELLSSELKDGSNFVIINNDTSASQSSSVVTSRSDFQISFSKDKQSNLTLLPDIATPGRNVLNTSKMVVSDSSDFVTSCGPGVLSNVEQSDFNKTALDLVNHEMEVNENLVTSSLSSSSSSFDSSKINSAEEGLICDTVEPPVSTANSVEGTENVGVDMSQVHRNQDFAFTESVTSHLHNTSLPTSAELESSLCSNISYGDGNSEIEESGDTGDISRNPILVGFSAVEVLSDAELHQYLQELEDNDEESEIGQGDVMECKTKAGISLSSECQDLSVSNSAIDSSEELPVRIYKAEGRRHDEGFKSLSNSTEITGTKTETGVRGGLPDDFRGVKSSRICSDVNTEFPKYSTSHESSVHCLDVSYETYSPNNESENVTTESHPCVIDKHTKNVKEPPVTPSFTQIEKPRTVPVQSVVSGTVKVDTSAVPIATANIPVSRQHDSNPQAVQTVPSATPVTSKTSSVIKNVVSIDCQKITQSSGQDWPENDRCSTKCSDSSKRVEGVREDIEINKLETETPSVIATEMKSPDCLGRVLDSDKIEHGMAYVKNEPSYSLNNSSSNQETNFDIAEDCQNTPEIILPSNETNSLKKTPNELIPISENEVSHPSIVDTVPKKGTSHEHSDRKNDVMGVSEVGFSEVRSCLVRMPRDGTTINVLGEEERPSRPKYLFLPSKITVENEQEDSENSEESPPMTGAVGKLGLESISS
jgi:hypothetical protein